MAHRMTIGTRIEVRGTGLHTGLASGVVMEPALAGSGIRLCHAPSLPQSVGHLSVIATERCTRVEMDNGMTVDTVEHLMAALAMTGITDILVSFDCCEAPILDGSSAEWVRAILDSGLVPLGVDPSPLRVLRPFELSVRGSHYSASPGPLSFDVSIDFPNTPIGYQSISVKGSDIIGLADSRTFVLEREIAALRAHGLALGGGLHNALVIGEQGPLNEEGFRHADECVRHKALDLIGDLFLVGGLPAGRFTAHRPGHASTSAFLSAMIESDVIGRDSASLTLAA